MQRCTQTGVAGIARRLGRRSLSTVTSSLRDVERIRVKCGSAGSIFVDLHNIGRVASRDPLLIYLPPFSTSDAETAPGIPHFLRRYPTAVINYRWAGFHPFEQSEPAPRPVPPAEDGAGNEADGFTHVPRWPFPIHDTLQGYNWIVENLAPAGYTRRDVYVYGSYLGASLATSMALTESHPHQRMAVRGCVAFNGIYDWTMFLPDHQINKKPGTRATNVLEEILGQPTDPTFQELRRNMPGLFGDPSHLFDSFASPCLFFQTPGLLVPEGFDVSADPIIAMLGPAARDESDDVQAAIRALMGAMQDKPPRRSPLVFPPRKSTLKLPETLLLHTPSPAPRLRGRRARRRKTPPASNDFCTQAEELAALMRRSLQKHELRERAGWDDNGFDTCDEIQRRVRVQDVGTDETLFQLPSRGEPLALDWLEERMTTRSEKSLPMSRYRYQDDFFENF